MIRFVSSVSAGVLVSGLLNASVASAADETESATSPDADATLVADAEAGSSPVERPGVTYRFVGARYRGIIVPKFMMNLFGDGGTTVYVNSAGPEFGIRKDGFEYSFGLWWAGYFMDPTPFKSSSDPIQAWELTESNISVIYLTTDFLWSQEFGPEFSLNYGVGAGFGFVFGSLIREQAYPAGGDPNDLDSYQVCEGPGVPNPVFCGNDNDHYAGFEEPNWFDGGSKPVIFPWLALQTGFRYKPHKNFVLRLDTGFGISGFFVGLGADYGL